MKAIIFLFLMVSGFLLRHYNGPRINRNASVHNIDTSGYHEPEILSIINLIATPEKYDGKKVRIVGYITLYFEGTALFLHKEDLDNVITKNAVWVDISRLAIDSLKKYNNHYVIIDGIFNSHMNGHMGVYSGSVKNITWLELWPPDTQTTIKKRKRIRH
jgi:hypothetical protein